MFPGWDDVVFCCNEVHLDDPTLELEKLLLEKRPLGKIVRVSNNTKGPGWAVMQTESLIDLARPVVVNYCDFTCFWNSKDLERILNSGLVDGCIPAYTGFHPHMAHSTSYAYLKMEGNKVTDIQEKLPWTDKPESEFASSGTYGFASGKILFDSLKSQIKEDINLNGEFYLSLTYKPLLASGGRVSTLNLQHFMQWGTPQDFEEYKDYSNAISQWIGVRAGSEGNESINSRIVLAAGAGSRFSECGYSTPKPALKLAGKTLLEHSTCSVPGNETLIVTRADLADGGVVNEYAFQIGAKVYALSEMSRGQADSALFGLLHLESNNSVTVTSCDAISVVDSKIVDSLYKEIGPEGLVVWVSKLNGASNRMPNQFGWVSNDNKNNVENVWIKKQPKSKSAGMITGTFGFGSRDYAIKLISSLIEDEETVNGEFYLDSLVQRQIESKKPCKVLEVSSFVSVGTPSEYESVLYWQSCFDKWPLHPYKAVNDPMINQNSIMEICETFRDFDPIV
jgi:NDP-sugar pyrophosphorylase family protein